MAATNKDVVLVVSLVLSLVSLVLLFGVTWYFQSSLDLLQQQVKYDRELLLKLQEQVNSQTAVNYDNTINTHHDVKRQSGSDCQCKDGIPGHIGLPGEKGATGPRGDPGDRGPRGVIGDPGYPGQTGKHGTEGDPGPRGDPGDRGPRGLIGDTGLRGPIGQPGDPGMKGVKGDQGDKGEPGPKGSTQLTSQGMKGDKGQKGSGGPTGLTGPKGVTGQKGVKGDKEERNGGTVYVRWGHDQCPSTAQLVYSGRTGGSYYQHGGASNPQCLPLDPNFLTPISGTQDRGLMYGAEYCTHTDSNSHLHGRHALDVPCAVCYVTQRSTVYMLPAKYTCPSGWTREYHGYLMSAYHKQESTQYTCIDSALKSVVGSAAGQHAMEFFFVEGRCGSLPCPPYDDTRELSCAVCTKLYQY